ncbi:hypothetical protein LSH36_542g00019, partial [Paralvinella palmiformis]
MKGSKHDGQTGHYSDRIINGTRKLHVYWLLLFSSMLFHGCVPDGLHLSTLIPIPKNKRKSLNDSHYDKFTTTDYQYGVKQQHSTVHCTFVVKEVIKYHLNNS